MTVIIKLRGLPWSASINEVREFFQGLDLSEEDIHLALGKDGKASGIAFAVFHRDEDARKAMFRTGRYMGRRYIELALSSITEMEKYLVEGVPESRKQRSERRHSDNAELVHERNGNRDVPRRGERENYHPRRSRSRSPPNRRHGSFGNSDGGKHDPRRFADNEGSYDREHQHYHLERKRRWEGASERERRLGDDRRDVGHARKRSREEDPLTCVRVIGLPFDAREEDVRRFFEGLDVIGIHFLRNKLGKFAGRPNGWGYVEFGSVGDCFHAESRNNEFMGKRYVEVKRCSREQMLREIDRTGGDQGPAEADPGPQYQRRKSPSPDRSANDLLQGAASLLESSLLLQLAAGANVSSSDIQLGCVVGIRNLPSSITAEEILDFFYGFPVAPDTVRIHYLAPGRSSGDAMVTLPTAADAINAIEQLNFKPVGKRNVQLFLV